MRLWLREDVSLGLPTAEMVSHITITCDGSFLLTVTAGQENSYCNHKKRQKCPKMLLHILIHIDSLLKCFEATGDEDRTVLYTEPRKFYFGGKDVRLWLREDVSLGLPFSCIFLILQDMCIKAASMLDRICCFC